MRKQRTPQWAIVAQEISLKLIAIEQDLSRYGLFGTMHKVNDAKKALGYEVAEKIKGAS